ncbi:uncharacterized protein LAESUDRAFT_728734 [Laetiporus sulphureus 93-53]|uniref:Uncharacterized protein n=1 Tax=Laetiporus sulphureus 93-53 TaxID=1314785 RepID=A0A165CY93_9APHY|nr:uncharacterized protein LAESUDRAFT_728734 [Laetiporus sulphureus 93-53]KZT03730.1 hypothetical protein LAESUDRAFT_728734 [Laetiporus sulphureus 93-53]
MKRRSQSIGFGVGSMARYTVDISAVVFAADLLWQPCRGSRQGPRWWQARVVHSLITPSRCRPRTTGNTDSCYERSERHI